jgi:hypothetical protein
MDHRAAGVREGARPSSCSNKRQQMPALQAFAERSEIFCEYTLSQKMRLFSV